MVVKAHSLRAQRLWLLKHFPADKAVLSGTSQTVLVGTLAAKLGGVFCCRCYFCGKLLAEKAIFPDKVDPNGTTRRNNLRPACREHVGRVAPREQP